MHTIIGCAHKVHNYPAVMVTLLNIQTEILYILLVLSNNIPFLTGGCRGDQRPHAHNHWLFLQSS
jgi:hypothetical protein